MSIAKVITRLVTSLILALLLTVEVSSAERTLADRPDVREFIDYMTTKHEFSKSGLNDLFNQVVIKQDIIDAISRPAESKPWYQYRPIFVTKRRVNGGVSFMNEYGDALSRARNEYGVPPEIITAIIGVETFYGNHKGGYRVMDALSTLAFDYPKRGNFFRSELEQYLLMAREDNFDPLSLKGSYAGAMGKPQFISSSYRRYAVDFDGDGQRDLLNNTEDAIGSVANYLKRHGWKDGQSITSKARIDDNSRLDGLDESIKPSYSLRHLKKKGIHISDRLPEDQKAALISLENRNGMEYWLGYHNFYVITRYNHSALYAMAVYQLSEEIRAAHSDINASLVQ